MCIEPLTAADWESKLNPDALMMKISSPGNLTSKCQVIELHASFLETNLLSQIRALPNPAFEQSQSDDKRYSHPLVLHLSPTSSADVIVTSLTPTLSSTTPFARIGPDAEVVVAPKSRTRPLQDVSGDHQMVSDGATAAVEHFTVASNSTRNKLRHGSKKIKSIVHFRLIDRRLADQWFEHGADTDNEGLMIWVNDDTPASRALIDAKWASVSVIKPNALLPPLEPRLQTSHANEAAGSTDTPRPATRVVARIALWKDPPDGKHVALSSFLCASLGVEGVVGGVVRLEPTCPPLPKKSLKSIQIHPFATSTPKAGEGLVFGGNTKSQREQLRRHLQDVYERGTGKGASVLLGPLTDGLVLAGLPDKDTQGWEGGLLTFGNAPVVRQESGCTQLTWAIGSDHQIDLDVQQAIPRPSAFFNSSGPEEPLPLHEPSLISVDNIITDVAGQIANSLSLLLTGGIGSGKTSLAQKVGHRLRRDELFYVAYYPCSKLITDDTRVSAVKETLDRLFITASFAAYLGGRAVVILDDIDKLCPAETELQVGNENGRSRQVSEVLCSMTKQFCGRETGVVLLATASAKDAVNDLLIKTHAIRNVVELKAPDKDGRREILQGLLAANNQAGLSRAGSNGLQITKEEEAAKRKPGFTVEKSLDFLELAGRTDGYMPGDLVLLISRTKGEAVLRNMSSLSLQSSQAQSDNNKNNTLLISIDKEDFARALQGFTPASLRNVHLHSTSTTFASVGGLRSVRQTLIETIQYPTKYARIFANCPLRLRSGLLLYGYPGCGKTLLASAVAGESGLNFISVKGPELLNKYIGASEKSVRDLFERAQAARPAILFFDEFDSIAPKRGRDSTGVTDRVVNQLLTQMDGAEGLQGVYVLAATSRPDLIDPALLRPGRLDKSLLCGLPMYDERLDILRIISKKVAMAEEVREQGLEDVARQTEGYSGADLQAVISNAQLEAVHRVLDCESKDDDSTEKKKKKKETDEKEEGTISDQDRGRSEGIPWLSMFKMGVAEDEQDRKNSESREWLGKRAAMMAKFEAIRQKEESRGVGRHLRARDKDPRGGGGGGSRLAADRREQQQQQQTSGMKTSMRAATNERGGREDGNEDEGEERETGGGKKGGVRIEWKDIQSALHATRPSISIDERRRLTAIYGEFINARTGDMPNGEATNEIGGRTSLM